MAKAASAGADLAIGPRDDEPAVKACRANLDRLARALADATGRRDAARAEAGRLKADADTARQAAALRAGEPVSFDRPDVH
jgi:hypothetical protein